MNKKLTKRVLSMFLAVTMVGTTILTPYSADAAQTNEVTKEATQEVSKTYLTTETAFNNTVGARQDLSEDIEFLKGSNSMSWEAQIKTQDTGIQALMSVSGAAGANNYVTLYMNNKRLGIEIRDAGNNKSLYHDMPTTLADNEWHTVKFEVVHNTKYTFTVDGTVVSTTNDTETKWIGSLPYEITKFTVGGAKRADQSDDDNRNWFYNGSMKNVVITKKVDPTPVERETFLGDYYKIFNLGYDGATNYRIPSLLTTQKGTVLAAIDKRWYHNADNGNIDTVLRRSTDNGDTWGDNITVLDTAAQANSDGTSSFLIDPLMVQDENTGRIFMLVDFFPQSGGYLSVNGQPASTGYKEVDGVQYQILKDRTGKQYTVREKGIVYDENNEITEYQVEVNPPAPYKELGNLYQNGEYVGNIYLYGGVSGAPLSVIHTSYIWLTYSDDEGETWSKPQDLTPYVKADWMKFYGTGPGVGIQLKNGAHKGRLVFPIYYTNSAGKQNSANIYSDDGGVTWQRGESPNDNRVVDANGTTITSQTTTGYEITESQIVELNNGHLLQFMRKSGQGGNVLTAISEDGGATWGPNVRSEAGVPEPYCQLSAIHWPEKVDVNDDGVKDEILIFSNPTSGRNVGTIRIGIVNPDDTISWVHSRVIDQGAYSYSCLTRLHDGNVGLLYEQDGVFFTKFDLNYIMYGKTAVQPKVQTTTVDNVKKPNIVHTIKDSKGNTIAAPVVGATLEVSVETTVPVTPAADSSMKILIGKELRKAVYTKTVTEGAATKYVFTYRFTAEDQGDVRVYPVFFGSIRDAADQQLVDYFNFTSLGAVGDLVGTPSETVIAPNTMTATAGSQHSASGAEGPAANVLDEDLNTIWHTAYGTIAPIEQRFITLVLDNTYYVDSLIYTPRTSGNNGTLKEYQVEVSTDGTNFTPIQAGTWAKNNTVKKSIFLGGVKATHVRLRSIDSGDDFATAASLRITGRAATAEDVDTTLVQNKLIEVNKLVAGAYTQASFDALKTVVNAVKTAIVEKTATQENIAQYVTQITAKMGELEERQVDKTTLKATIAVAKGMTVTSESHTPTTFNKFKTALANAEAIDQKEGATYLEVEAANTALLAAIDGLIEFPVYYQVSVKPGYQNGTVRVSNVHAQEGDKVYVNATPDLNCHLVSITANQNVTLTPVEGATGRYTFNMPAADVEITASFAKDDGAVSVTGVTLNKNSVTLYKKVTEKLTATVAPENATLKDVTWTSSNHAVASVDETGLVTTKSLGTADITVTTVDGSFASTCTVTVAQDPNASAELSTTGMTATAGSQETTGENGNASNVLDGDTSTIWHTKYTGGADTRDKHWITIDLGKTYEVDELTYLPRQGGGINGIITKFEVHTSEDGTNFTKAQEGTWAGDDLLKSTTFTKRNAKYVKLVSVESLPAGSAFTTASEIRIFGKTIGGSETVEVTSVTLNKNATSIQVGATETLTATVNPSNATNKTVTWSSSNTEVATVSNSGVVTAKKAGNTVITATAGSKSATCTITVTAPPVVVDKTALNAKIAVAETKVEATYTEATWATFKTALANAKTIAAKTNATQKEVNDALAALTTAMNNLVEKPVVADKTALNAKIAVAETKVEATYTEATWASFKAALATAKTIAGKTNATQKEVNDALAALTSAMNGLVEKPVVADKTALNAKIAVAETKVEATYTQATWASFKAALATAKTIAGKTDATQKEVNDALAALTSAMDNLKEVEIPQPEVKHGWVEENNTYRYYQNDKVVANKWVKESNGTWKYAGKDGWMAKKWLKDGATWYYLGTDGIMKTGWQKVDGVWYLLANSGKMKTGWQQVGGTWYLLANSGKMLTGWQKVGGTWYYLASSGKMMTGWYKEKGTWYYLKSSGAMATGWVKDAGKWYYMSGSGKMQTGWVLVKGTWYYLKANGAMATGWTKVGAKSYYLSTISGAWNGQTK